MLIRNSDQPRLTARFDNPRIPIGQSSRRVLLLEVDAPKVEDAFAPAPSQPLNLALVIDRSASMARGRLDAAKRAAMELCNELGSRDRLSLVSFDDHPETHFQARKMNTHGRRRSIEEIHALYTGGCTNLAAGWHSGASCAAQAIDEHALAGGHVIVLSDGHANRGMRDPGELGKYASGLAERGVRTSAVGIGDDYSPLQLDALAEGGQGELHDSARGEELTTLLLGEARELRETRIREVALTLHGARHILVPFVTRAPASSGPGRMNLPIGSLPPQRTRRVGLLLDVPPCAAGQTLPFHADLEWVYPSGLAGNAPKRGRRRRIELPALTPCEPGEAQAAAPDLQVVTTFADLYEAALTYELAVLNEHGNYHKARAMLNEHRKNIEELVRPLPDADARVRRLQRLEHRADRPDWDGRDKRVMYSFSKHHSRH